MTRLLICGSNPVTKLDAPEDRNGKCLICVEWQLTFTTLLCIQRCGMCCLGLFISDFRFVYAHKYTVPWKRVAKAIRIVIYAAIVFDFSSH